MPGTFPLLHLQLTYSCNLRCEMCGQWGRDGIFRHKIQTLKKEELGTADWLAVLDEAARYDAKPCDKYGARIHLWGGEPLLSGSFREIVSGAKKHGLTLSMVTNGTLLEESAEFVTENPFVTVSVSLDGDRETHDSIRGVPGTFSKVISGLKTLKKVKDRKKSITPCVTVMCAVQKRNAGILEKIIETAAAAGADRFLLAPLMFITPEADAAQRRFMRERLETEWKCSSGWDCRSMGDGCAGADPLLARLPLSRSGMEIVTNLPVSATLGDWFGKPQNTFGRKKCLVPWKNMNIAPNGDCNFCVDFPDFKIGTVRENSVMEIWGGERARRFRAAMEADGPFPACARCVWLYNDLNGVMRWPGV